MQWYFSYVCEINSTAKRFFFYANKVIGRINCGFLNSIEGAKMQQSIKCLSVEWFNWFDSDFLKILIMKTIRYLMLIILKNNRRWFQREIELAFILDESIVNIPIWNLFQPIWTHSNTNVSPPTFDVSFFCSLDCLFVCLFVWSLAWLHGYGAVIFNWRWCKTAKSIYWLISMLQYILFR